MASNTNIRTIQKRMGEHFAYGDNADADTEKGTSVFLVMYENESGKVCEMSVRAGSRAEATRIVREKRPKGRKFEASYLRG